MVNYFLDTSILSEGGSIMKKRSLIILSLITAFCLALTMGLSACGNDTASEEPAEEAVEEEVVDTIDGSVYGYTGEDPVEAACYEYMAETVSKDYEAADASIPTVSIIKTDTSSESETLVYGNFWIENYNIDADTLKCVSGGNYPGCMHVDNTTYKVTAFDAVGDGSEFEPTAKEIFGDSYDEFMKAYSDSDARTELRKATVANYVKANGLDDIKYYQDEGWDPVELVLE